MFLLRPVVWVLAALAYAVSSSTHAAEGGVFSPQGEIKGVRQVRAQFSEPMIPFGDPRAGETSPFIWSCSGPSPQAQARWADPKNWILDFSRDLVAGVSCRFELRADAKTLQGAALGGARVFEFTTGAPAIDAIQPYPDTRIAEDQAFIIKFDGAVAPSAFEKSLFLIVEGMDEKVPLTPVEPALRDSILKAKFASRGYDLKKLENRAVVRGRTNLPPGKAVKLVWLPEKSRSAAPAAAPAERTGIRDRLKGMLKRWKDQAAEGPAVNPEGQSFDYTVRQPFRATFTCERENAESPCLPITPMVLTFSSSADWKLLAGARIEGVGGGGSFKPKQPEEAAAKSGKSAVLVEQLVFEPPFPENRKFRLVLPSGLQDDAGRTLDNAATFPLEIATGRLPPLAKFSANFGIIESRPEAVVPLTLRQVEGSLSAGLVEIPGSVARIEGSSLKSILEMMNRAGQQDGWESRQKSVIASIPGLSPKKFTAKKANPEAAFEVIGVPLPGPGFYLLEVNSPRLGAALNESKKPVFVSTAVLATNLGVHLKRSREDSLVWVTELDSARPVGDAEVVLMDCSGNELARGRTDREGIWKGPVVSPASHYCDKPSGRGVYAFAKKGEDFSFVNSEWDGGIESWRFNMPGVHSSEENGAHTVLARTLLDEGLDFWAWR